MEDSLSPARLVAEFGGTYARELGIDLSQGDTVEIQKWFLAAVLFGARISTGIAVKTYLEFDRAKLVQPGQILDAGRARLVRTLGLGGYARYDFKTASKLTEVSGALLRNYAGDLNVLHRDAADAADLERRIRQLGKGIGDVTVAIFLREMRGIWQKAQPLPSERTIQAARTSGFIDADISDKAQVLQALMTAWREDGMRAEEFPKFEVALVRYGATLRRKRTQPAII